MKGRVVGEAVKGRSMTAAAAILLEGGDIFRGVDHAFANGGNNKLREVVEHGAASCQGLGTRRQAAGGEMEEILEFVWTNRQNTY